MAATLLEEQPLPIKGGHVISDDAIEHINRTLYFQNFKGIERYGRGLATFNGRDSIRDIWEEIADLVNYCEAMSQEYKFMKLMLKTLYTHISEVKTYIDNQEDSETFIRFINE